MNHDEPGSYLLQLRFALWNEVDLFDFGLKPIISRDFLARQIRQGSSRFCGASYPKRCKGPKAPHTDSRQVTRVQSANLGDVGMSEECLCS